MVPLLAIIIGSTSWNNLFSSFDEPECLDPELLSLQLEESALHTSTLPYHLADAFSKQICNRSLYIMQELGTEWDNCEDIVEGSKLKLRQQHRDLERNI